MRPRPAYGVKATMPTVDRGDCRLWWDAEGNGDPLLLIMGLGYPSAMWYRLLPTLTARWRTIRFDNRGTGETGVPPGPYTIESMADDAIAVLDAAGVTTAHVLGASMGGFIAQHLVIQHPDRVRSLVLACTGPAGAEMAPPEPEALAMAAARSTMTPEAAGARSNSSTRRPHRAPPSTGPRSGAGGRPRPRYEPVDSGGELSARPRLGESQFPRW
jgi:pimeloyl-ACP methyl ester carboxylesterase